MSHTHQARLFDPLMNDGRVDAVLGDAGYVRAMLAFEAALARAEAQAGVIPADAAHAINTAIDTIHGSELDDMAAAIAEGTARAGTPVIPLVKLLTARTDPVGQPYVHWGATTQDVMDTALVMQVRDVCTLLDEGLGQLGNALASLAQEHRDTPMVARTVMQHALPTTFGLKAAGWLSTVTRHHGRLGELGPRVMALQFGGAAGTLASLGNQGPAVSANLARELGLILPDVPWHSARDRVGDIAMFCGLLCGTLGKIGRDVVLMMQTDVQEAFEPVAPGRGGSSTMPHKRNPVLAAVMIGAGTAAPGLVSTILSAQMHEHERAAGSAHAEWRTLPDLLRLAGGALKAAITLIEGLEIDEARMRLNLEATNGLIMAEAVMMALGRRIGRLQAHHLVEAACKTAVAGHLHLQAVLSTDTEVTAHLTHDELAKLFEPESYLGSAGHFVDSALSAHRALAT
ncbi:MAG: 3-carboxy-cis,cis-muconate cycloisomerase [Bosea sp. (in: a-proteobacteria)]